VLVCLSVCVRRFLWHWQPAPPSETVPAQWSVVSRLWTDSRWTAPPSERNYVSQTTMLTFTRTCRRTKTVTARQTDRQTDEETDETRNKRNANVSWMAICQPTDERQFRLVFHRQIDSLAVAVQLPGATSFNDYQFQWFEFPLGYKTSLNS